MALQIHSPSSFTYKPYHHLPNKTLLHFTTKPKFRVKSQNPSESQQPISKIDESIPVSASSNKPNSSGQGFGSFSSPPSKENENSANEKRSKRTKGQRASIIRRSPVEKPIFVGEVDEKKVEEQRRNESAFLLAWLGLGAVILVEGIALAASGFLPEKWDNFLVKYLYPSFTPTVVLFIAGTVAYGVLKYLQNEKIKGQE